MAVATPPLVGEPPVAAVGRRRRGPDLLAGVVGLAVTLVVAASVAFVAYAHAYQPLGPGNFGFGPEGGLRTVTDGISDTNLILTGPAGATGWFGFSVEDSGSHPVTMLGIDGFNPYSYSLRWGHVATGHGADIVGRLAQSLPFPAHISPGGQIMTFVVIRRPACQPGEIWSIEQIPLAWEALGVHHDDVVRMGQQSGTLPVLYCYPGAALRHVTNSF